MDRWSLFLSFCVSENSSCCSTSLALRLCSQVCQYTAREINHMHARVKIKCLFLFSFQATVFRSSYGERLSITPESARCVVHVRQQAMLILIETLDLENLLLMVHDETPFRFFLCFLSWQIQDWSISLLPHLLFSFS